MRVRLILSFAVLLFILPLIFTGCDDTITNNDVENLVFPDKDVSFSKHVFPVFQGRCAFSGCHGNIAPANGIDLTTHSGVTADQLIVFPGSSRDSRLAWAIDGTGPILMPPNGFRGLTKNQIDGIKRWIDEGAKNN